MKIVTKLKSISVNEHWMNRYINFCVTCHTINANNADNENLVRHHILSRHMFPQYENFTNNSWNMALLTHRQHLLAHYMLYKCTNNYKDALAVMWSRTLKTTDDISVLSLHTKLYESTMESIISKKRHLVVVKDNNGNTFSTDINDPRYISGELVGATKGKGVYISTITNESIMLDVNDPRVLSGEFVGYTKNMTIYKHNLTGDTLHLDTNDPRVLSGEYVGINVGLKFSDERKELYSKMLSGKGNPMYGSRFRWANNGKNNKRINIGSGLPEGYTWGYVKLK